MNSTMINSFAELPIKYIRQNQTAEGQKTKRKKAIIFLKQEMTKIREGMTNILRVKSEKNLEFLSLSQNKSNIEFDRQSKTTSSREFIQKAKQQTTSEATKLKQRVSLLEAQNSQLIQKMRILQNNNRSEIEDLIRDKIILQANNQSLYAEIGRLAEQVQSFGWEIRQLREQKQKKGGKIELRAENGSKYLLNPECEVLKLGKQYRIDVQKLARQNKKLVNKAEALQMQITVKQSLLEDYKKLMEELNYKILKLQLTKMNKNHQNVGIF